MAHSEIEMFLYVMLASAAPTHISGLPPHLQAIKAGKESFSTRREFHKGKATKKKRGK